MTDEMQEPYLVRWNILSCKWFSIKIHKILLDDYDCLHDHPWWFYTFILKGGYIEHTPKEQRIDRKDEFESFYESSTGTNRKRLIHPLTLHYRPANWKHKLEVIRDKNDKPTPCYTLVFAGKRKQDWGFWNKLGFVHWREYNSGDRCE